MWRLAHMGYHDQFDVIAAISALELTLMEMGHKLTPGGVAARSRHWRRDQPRRNDDASGIDLHDKLEASGLDLLKHGGLEVDNRPGLAGASLQKAQAADGADRSQRHAHHGGIAGASGQIAGHRPGRRGRRQHRWRRPRKGIVVMNTPGGNTISAANIPLHFFWPWPAISPPPTRPGEDRQMGAR